VQKTGAVREEGAAGVTSVPPERADAAQGLALVQGHWHSEPQSHGVRDVTFDEAHLQVRCVNIPQGRATQHGHGADAVGRVHEYCGDLSPLCSPANVSSGAYWYYAGKPNGPGVFALLP